MGVEDQLIIEEMPEIHKEVYIIPYENLPLSLLVQNASIVIKWGMLWQTVGILE